LAEVRFCCCAEGGALVGGEGVDGSGGDEGSEGDEGEDDENGGCDEGGVVIDGGDDGGVERHVDGALLVELGEGGEVDDSSHLGTFALMCRGVSFFELCSNMA